MICLFGMQLGGKLELPGGFGEMHVLPYRDVYVSLMELALLGAPSRLIFLRLLTSQNRACVSLHRSSVYFISQFFGLVYYN